jgi:hypothetical protein
MHLFVFQGVGPIQVRYADGERERLGNNTCMEFYQRSMLRLLDQLGYIKTNTAHLN